MDRNHAIDTFRGLAIIGMVFFTVTLRLSNNLPELLRHNVRGSLHLGDFVLPMFLFASGLSLAYFLKKREKEEQKPFFRDVVNRFVKLALVGISLSFFSANGFFEMDEVMLSALLFIACIALYILDWKIILGVIFFINLSYILLMQLDLLSIFMGHYLGGYPAALYYLPVMLTGLILGKGIVSKGLWCKSNKIIISVIFSFLIFFWIFIPINKMSASPTFIMLSILFSFLIIAVVILIMGNKIFSNELEFIGRKPLRYWIMMFIIFIIPVRIYDEFSGQVLSFQLPWFISVITSLGLMIIFWGTSHIIDYFTIKNKI